MQVYENPKKLGMLWSSRNQWNEMPLGKSFRHKKELNINRINLSSLTYILMAQLIIDYSDTMNMDY
jgi:hypothetical protein